MENNALKGATERLADALAEPLLDPVNADKERNAVNAELTMARSRDGHRMYQVRRKPGTRHIRFPVFPVVTWKPLEISLAASCMKSC